MIASTLVCKNDLRRETVRATPKLNGLDFLQVSDDQLTLVLYFLGKAPPVLNKDNVIIKGGRRITDIRVTSVEIHREEDPETDDCVHIGVDKPGDFSTYCICLIESYLDKEDHKHTRPLSGFDPRYACLEFTFKAGCPSDLDCKPQVSCPPEQPTPPDINYLAKDYASFRQLILDRLALTMPDWQERHVPDLGITLVELLAYVGDHLSYYQDAVGTEAYLDTARRRISVRRHVRLVDYQLHEGCNARAWVVFEVSSDLDKLKADDFYLTTNPGLLAYGNVLDHSQLANIEPKPYLIFEPLLEDKQQNIAFWRDHNEIKIYTWDDEQCCLPKGSTSVSLSDPGTATPPETDDTGECGPHHEPQVIRESPLDSDYRLKLKPCDIIIFEEVKGPKTGNLADADPSHRHAVRLTKAEKSQDPLTKQLIWDIEWAAEDALPFALCISSSKQQDCSPVIDVSIVRGNVLLVDHGESVSDKFDPVPLETTLTPCGDACLPRETVKIAGRFTPSLSKTDLTFSQPLLPCKPKLHQCLSVAKSTPAAALLKQDVRLAVPEVTLHDGQTALVWQPRLDLLSSDAEDRNFVVEIEDDRRAQLRFGDGESGRLPEAETEFTAKYRVGNGTVGNIGAEAISHIVFRNNLPNGVDIFLRNPLYASGGTNPEPMAEAKLFAPQAFRKTLQRAITADDYVQIVMRDFASRVQRAAATLRWTGSWTEVLVAVDPLGSEDANKQLLRAIKHHLHRYRRIGHDVNVLQASYVALDITLTVCVLPHFLKSHVKAALLDVFSSGAKTNHGSTGYFHPDKLSFGDGIYLSQLVATAQAVEGVESVMVSKLERYFAGPNDELKNGLLPLGPFEVARLDNDPSFPENGKLTLDLRGGR
jgi:hypothetical protein